MNLWFIRYFNKGKEDVQQDPITLIYNETFIIEIIATDVGERKNRFKLFITVDHIPPIKVSGKTDIE